MTRHRIVSPGLLVAAVVAVAACSPREENKAAAPDATPPASSTPASPPASATSTPQPPAAGQSATVGGDGSQIRLDALTPADVEGARLTGELGCSFSTPEASPLLLAMGDVASKDAAQGVVKVAGYVERIGAPGGFDGMLKGATFSGAGKTIRIAVTGPAAGGGESPPSPATLTYERMDGASRTWIGSWTCGP